ncbi:MAG: aminomethyl-transferring glycine dehydrogenase [Bacteroidales bacterium]|nr:aminomethyl-transferring glycine dehydrogenase [Bacteroidales bacterium]
MITDNFARRHNGPNPEQTQKMLQTIGVKSMDELIEKTVPAAIRLSKPLDLPPAMNEYQYLNHLHQIAGKNQVFRSYIGLGYYNCITPAVITRNILENAGWYTSYTPYQAEISQGRLEALLNYQTVIANMTGLPLTNASLLDEGTAAAEAMIMFYHGRNRDKVKANANVCFVDERLFPQTISVIQTRAHLLGFEIEIGRMEDFSFRPEVFGAIVQQVDRNGQVHELKNFIDAAHAAGSLVAVAADLMALAVLRAPGEDGADCVFGNSQRFGLPMGFGGPSAGFFACTDNFKRSIPGRIIGVTVDAQGNRALRLALQTREQHIKRDKATSNICTAQALMAVMSGMYAVYHGKDGIEAIALDIHGLAKRIAKRAAEYGYKPLNSVFFDTVCLESPVSIEAIRRIALEHRINFNYIDDTHLSISIDETTSLDDVREIIGILAQATGKEHTCNGGACCKGHCKQDVLDDIPANLRRNTPYLEHPVFNTYHSETEMMRYIKKLEEKDLSLNRAMIPLGSCTMKLNAAAEMMCLSLPEMAAIHPFVPADQAQGYHELIDQLEKDLCEITGFAKASFQPNSGAAGEYTGLSVIRAYQEAKGESHRNICLIPASAHGTNPASAAMAGLKVVVVASTPEGEIDVNDLKAKVAEHGPNVSCLMITYPSTHGVFEEAVLEILGIVHGCGAQVYMDGANMNAQVGLTSPGHMGADVCHLNLHKTFAMPHGGGGPGVGPICVAKHLAPYLPDHVLVPVSHTGRNAVSSSPYGSAFILPITYGYIRMLGAEGLKSATEYAILNANYLRARLKDHYKIFFTGKQGMCAHEMILDCNQFMMSANVQVGDIAKRLMDYGFHAPTVAFPVHGTLMVEPTESEPLSELDRLVDAFIAIRAEIKEIEDGKADRENNVIHNAPHTQLVVCADEWKYPYSRKQAAFPLPHDDKYWPTVGKVDDAYGDRNLQCTLV